MENSKVKHKMSHVSSYPKDNQMLLVYHTHTHASLSAIHAVKAKPKISGCTSAGVHFLLVSKYRLCFK